MNYVSGYFKPEIRIPDNIYLLEGLVQGLIARISGKACWLATPVWCLHICEKCVKLCTKLFSMNFARLIITFEYMVSLWKFKFFNLEVWLWVKLFPKWLQILLGGSTYCSTDPILAQQVFIYCSTPVHHGQLTTTTTVSLWWVGWGGVDHGVRM